MSETYTVIKFQRSVKRDVFGDSKLLNDLMKPLESICRDFHGLEEFYMPCYGTGGELIEETKKYIVKTCFVTINANLGTGTVTTTIKFHEKHEYKELINEFKELYSSKHMSIEKITI